MFLTNEFTWIFQQITDTYGIPKYGEINPSLFSCVTFPFLFGIMFGDICHGGLLFLVGLGLCHFSDDIFASINARSPMHGVMQLRYLLLMMGFYATFCGLMYNDFASIPLFFGTSCYVFETHPDGAIVRPQTPELMDGCVHTIGVDPAWYLSGNEITYMNSLKMKLAVIVGVAHMSLGVLMKGFNAAYYKCKTDFFFEFIPQFVMLVALFGYMDYIIMVKWSTDWTDRESRSPSIIASMISMFLGGGVIPEGSDPLLQTAEHQKNVQINLLTIVLICAPAMLIPKPLIVYYTAKTDHDLL